ncbi:MAG: lipid biosynthesis B12-binding/radical SAM protein [bacterium]
MRALLISANVAKTPYPVYPLGMGMVAAALTDAGHEVAQYDFLQHDLSLESLRTCVTEATPQVVGISIRNIDNVNLVNEQRYLDTVSKIVAVVREATSAPVVLGGSGFSLMPEEILAKVGGDYGVVGEGEALMVQFVDSVARGTLPKERILRGSCVLQGDAIQSAIYDPTIMRYYLGSGYTASVQTKRGCTHRCAYCSYPMLEGFTIRCRPVDAVVDDLERLVRDFGVKMVFFTDSVFNDDEGHYLEVLRDMRRRNVRVPWIAFMKPEAFSEDTLLLMRETGLRAVELGADAPTDTTLRGLRKSFSFADVEECNRRLTNHGIAVAHYYMFGGPGETADTVREGIRNIIGLNDAVSFMFMGIRVLPGTPLAKIAERDGITKPGQDLVDPVYYIAPGLDRQWLHETLTNAFKDVRHCVFPPDAFEDHIRLLHQLGHVGVLWDILKPGKKGRGGQRKHEHA